MSCTLSSLYAQLKQRLSALGLPQEQLEAECRLMLADVTGIHTSLRLIAPETPISKEHQARLFEIVEKRIQERVPVQYLLAQADFFGLKLLVTPDVLIPRPETELLVEQALHSANKFLESQGQQESIVDILDLGTGSGAIAIALASKLQDKASISATDICANALAVAQKNADCYALEIVFYQGDWFSALPQGKRFDFILSNPPYIGEAEKAQMSPEVLRHEPHQALFAPNNERERYYRQTAEQAAHWLKPGGEVFMELGFGLADSVASLFQAAGFSKTEVYPDLAGIPRILHARV